MYDLLQNEKLDANSWANGLNNPVTPKNSYTQNIFGGTIGGPILKNRLFFSGDYQGIRSSLGWVEFDERPYRGHARTGDLLCSPDDPWC